MTRADRLELIARLIRDRPGVTTGAIAEELGVSPRTVFRDVDALRTRGLPVEADRGRGGGVRLPPRWGLGTVLLATDEALAALLSLAISEKLGFPMFASGVMAARRKIVDAFPSAERRRIGPLRERVFVGRPASTAVRASYREPGATTIRSLQTAFVRERVVEADYVREDGHAMRRRIEPHALLINWPAWYLLGFDREREAPRTFRLDRFLSATETAESFRPRPQEMARAALGPAIVASM